MMRHDLLTCDAFRSLCQHLYQCIYLLSPLHESIQVLLSLSQNVSIC